MTTRQLIAKEIQKVPESMLDEVLDFIRFLEVKIVEKKATSAILSESTLKKDWLRPEEDVAWQNL